MRRRTAFARACLLALAFLALGPAPAAARELVIGRFDAQITVHSDATIDVTETIAAHFTGHWNGIYRTIPVEYETPQGFNYTLFISSASATDDEGNRLKLESSRNGAYRKFKIWVPGAEDASRVVILHYTVENGLRFLEDHDELYWNITGDEWDVAIEDAGARIELPESVSGVRTLVYTGSRGSRESDASVEVHGNVIQVHMRRPLSFHEGLTAVIGWDKGAVSEPSKSALASQFLRSNWPLFIPVATFFLMLFLWYTTGRDPRLKPIAVQYDPPDKLTPAQAGSLAEEKVSSRDITATLVDLAVRGYLTIEQKESSHMLGLMHSHEYVFHMKQPAAKSTDLNDFELEMINGLFEAGARPDVSLSDLHNSFYQHMAKMRTQISSSLVSLGYYLHTPENVRGAYIAGGVLIGIAIAALGSKLLNSMGVEPTAMIIAGVATGIIIAGFGWFMPTRTQAGTDALEHVLGFEEFLGRVEEPRFAAVVKTPEMFEKFLPFAMALGVEKKWVGAFQDICRQPPSWYQGPYGAGFQPIFFVNDLNAMSASAASVMASAPRSSGGSGFGGGGFSGGGFGGGGGGGF